MRIFDRLGFDYVIVAAMSGAMGGSASEEFLANVGGRRGHLRPLHQLRLRSERRGGQGRRARRDRVRRPAARPRRAHPGHADDRDAWSTTSTPAFPRDDGRAWTAGDTLKNVIVTVKHPDGTREPLAIGVPGDRDIDLKRLGAQVEPAEIEAFDEADFARNPSAGQGLHRSRRARQERLQRHPLPARPPRGRRHLAGSPAPTRRRPPRDRAGRGPRLHRRRDDRGRGRARRRPLPSCAGIRSRPRAASRWATSSSSARSTPRRSTSECSTRTASSSPSRWAPTASGSHEPSPPSWRTPTTTAGSSGPARSLRPTSTSSPPARTRRSSRLPNSSPATSRRPV